MLAGRAVRLRRLPRLRRGRPPLRHRAVRRAGRAARDRPADRPAAPGHPARAAALPARRAVRPRADPGLGVHRTGSASPSRSWSGGCAAGRMPRTRAASRSAEASRAGRGLAGRRGARRGVAAAARSRAGCGPGSQRTRADRAAHRDRRARPRSPGWRPAWWSCSSGHVAMVSFTEHPGRVELETIEREFPDLLPALVDHPGVGFVLVRSAEFGPVVLGRDGVRRLATGDGARRGPARRLRPARRRPRPPRRRLPALPGRHDQQPVRPGDRRRLPVRAARRLARRDGRPAVARLPDLPGRAAPRRARSSARRRCTACCAAG